MGGTLSHVIKGKRSPGKTNSTRPDLGDKYLSQIQKDLIRKTWKILETDMADHGTQIFLDVFKISPEAKRLFPFRDVEGDALFKHPQFKGHALRFMKAVGVTIDNLDALDVILIPNLIHLGRKHAKIKDFTTEYFCTFREAMDREWSLVLGKHYNTMTRQAWTHLFLVITSKIEEGYYDALQEGDVEPTSPVAIDSSPKPLQNGKSTRPDHISAVTQYADETDEILPVSTDIKTNNIGVCDEKDCNTNKSTGISNSEKSYI